MNMRNELQVKDLEAGLWSLSKETVSEEGECEDGVDVTAVRYVGTIHTLDR